MQQPMLEGWNSRPEKQCAGLDALLQAVIAEARAIGVPVSDHISPQVVVNRRAKTRLGCCRKSGETYIIEISHHMVGGPVESQKKILAHEILHTCYGCRNHGARWLAYAKRMQTAYGYSITRVDSYEKLGVSVQESPRYVVCCRRCGQQFPRLRASNLTKHPERYRCKCGGKLYLK